MEAPLERERTMPRSSRSLWAFRRMVWDGWEGSVERNAGWRAYGAVFLNHQAIPTSRQLLFPSGPMHSLNHRLAIKRPLFDIRLDDDIVMKGNDIRRESVRVGLRHGECDEDEVRVEGRLIGRERGKEERRNHFVRRCDATMFSYIGAHLKGSHYARTPDS